MTNDSKNTNDSNKKSDSGSKTFDSIIAALTAGKTLIEITKGLQKNLDDKDPIGNIGELVNKMPGFDGEKFSLDSLLKDFLPVEMKPNVTEKSVSSGPKEAKVLNENLHFQAMELLAGHFQYELQESSKKIAELQNQLKQEEKEFVRLKNAYNGKVDECKNLTSSLNASELKRADALMIIGNLRTELDESDKLIPALTKIYQGPGTITSKQKAAMKIVGLEVKATAKKKVVSKKIDLKTKPKSKTTKIKTVAKKTTAKKSSTTTKNKT